ncbi:tail fiber assembly protein [Enterobacter ludwigii]|uniref:tail fiber assembly protein n=1 Tax=Enterobacter ludwigii TaxID=299767 RepID=UPI003BEF4998
MLKTPAAPKNARYSAPDNAMIDCIIGLSMAEDSKDTLDVLFTASPDDPEEYGRQLYADLVAGKYGEVEPYVPPVTEPPEADPGRKKMMLLAEAECIIAPLERAVKYSMATEQEKADLEAWEKYSVLLSRIKPEDAPEIEWPDKPE